MMKRYLLFAGDDFNGGWSDLKGVFDDAQKAINKAKKGEDDNDWHWWQVVDVYTGMVIATDDLDAEELIVVNKELEQRVAQFSS